ncbi:MAG: alpha/beta hydrolase [Oligoflexia bacterium]|nr:alpha/beta hydrolase [Oligoflexia bacterium]
MDYKLKGKYNGFSFILFPGAGSPYNHWDQSHLSSKTLHHLNKPKTTKFISTLSSISQVFMYNPYEYIEIFGYKKFASGKLKYPSNKQLLINTHCRRLYKFIKTKNVNLKPPYILIAHSIGGFYALAFAKLFPKEVKKIFLIDPTKHTDELRNLTKKDFQMLSYNHDMFADKSDSYTNDIITGMSEFLVKFKKSENHNFKEFIDHKVHNFFFSKLLYTWDILSWDHIPRKIASHIQLISMFNLPSKDDISHQDIIDMNMLTKKYDRILKEKNKNYRSYFFKDRSHFLHWSDPEKVIKIITNNLSDSTILAN